MKTLNLKNKLKSGLLATVTALCAIVGTFTETKAQEVKNVVLVHGAFADGSGFKALSLCLRKKVTM